jgi:integrase
VAFGSEARFFCAQLQVKGKPTWPRLNARVVAEAVAELNTLKVQRSEGALQVVRHAPKLSEAIEQYKAGAEYRSKRPSSRTNEKGYLQAWAERLGHVRVGKITGPMICRVRDELGSEERKAPGQPLPNAAESHLALTSKPRNPRTCNLYVGALMKVLKFCLKRGLVARLPEVERLKQPKSPRRTPVSDGQFHALLNALTPDLSKNAALLRYFLRSLALTGAREKGAARKLSIFKKPENLLEMAPQQPAG